MRGNYRFNSRTERLPELNDLVSAANDVAQTARNLLTTMVAVALAMAATMLAASDEALLRDSFVAVEGLQIKARLSLVYLLTPMLFVFMHVHALLQLRLLDVRLKTLETDMAGRGFAPDERAHWRHLVHGFAFAQFLLPFHGGGRTSAYWWIARVISWVAIVVVPLTLLLTVQVSFLRYQNWWITLVHQVCLSLDMAALLWFTFAVNGVLWSVTVQAARGRAQAARAWLSLPAAGRRAAWTWPAWRHLRPSTEGRLAWAVLSALFLAWFSWFQAVPPSPRESAEAVRWHPAAPERWWDGDVRMMDRIAGLTGWSWTRRYLDLSRISLIERESRPEVFQAFYDATDSDGPKAKRQASSLDLRGRRFHFADFTGALLYSANMADVEAEKSLWQYARLKGAIFDRAHLTEADFSHAQMQEAFLLGTHLIALNAEKTNLAGGHLEGVKLHGAALLDVDLSGADLRKADLRGVTMTGGTLDHSDLNDAEVDYTLLENVSLQNLQGNTVKACENMLIISKQRDTSSIHDTENVECQYRVSNIASEKEKYWSRYHNDICNTHIKDKKFLQNCQK